SSDALPAAGPAATSVAQSQTKGAPRMTIIRHETGPRMSQASIFNGVVYLARQIAAGTTVQEQTQGALNEIDRLLALSGSSKERILSAQIWLAAMADFAAMNEAWE